MDSGDRSAAPQKTSRDGVEDDFQLKATPTSVESVTVNGVAQTVTTNYTVSGDTVTFVTAPADDAIIQIIYK